MLRFLAGSAATIVLVGCGGEKKDDAPKPGPSATMNADRDPTDVRIVVRTGGPNDTIFTPPADAERQRVTFVNRSRYDGVVMGRSRSGGGGKSVPAGSRASVTWRRSSGPDRLRVSVRFPGHSALNSSSTVPIG